MLRSLPLVGLIFVLFSPSSLRADDAPKAQAQELDGKWESTSVTFDGDKGDGEYFVTLLFEQDKMVFTEGSRIIISVDGAAPRPVEDSASLKGAIKVNPKSWAIDFFPESASTTGNAEVSGSPKGLTVKAIYNINKDVLLLCMSDKARPTEFSSEKGSGRTLVRLKRVKK